MNCTDEMYQAFKDEAFGPNSDNETMADNFKNGIEAAIEVMVKGKAVGKVSLIKTVNSHMHVGVLNATAVIDGLVEEGTELYVK